MSKYQMALLTVLAVVMWTAIAALSPRYPVTMPIQADGSAPSLPAPIEVGPGRIP